MSVLYFILLVITIVFALCSLASIIQFFIDLHRNSTMCKDLQLALKRIKKCSCFDEIEQEEERGDNG